MPNDFIAAGQDLSPHASRASTFLRRACLKDLEASLDNSRKALLALDLTSIECETRRQESWARMFDELLRRELPTSYPEAGLTKAARLASSTCVPELEEGFRHSVGP